MRQAATITYLKKHNEYLGEKYMCVGRNFLQACWDSTNNHCINSVVLNQLYKKLLTVGHWHSTPTKRQWEDLHWFKAEAGSAPAIGDILTTLSSGQCREVWQTMLSSYSDMHTKYWGPSCILKENFKITTVI